MKSTPVPDRHRITIAALHFSQLKRLMAGKLQLSLAASLLITSSSAPHLLLCFLSSTPAPALSMCSQDGKAHNSRGHQETDESREGRLKVVDRPRRSDLPLRICFILRETYQFRFLNFHFCFVFCLFGISRGCALFPRNLASEDEEFFKHTYSIWWSIEHNMNSTSKKMILKFALHSTSRRGGVRQGKFLVIIKVVESVESGKELDRRSFQDGPPRAHQKVTWRRIVYFFHHFYLLFENQELVLEFRM